MFKPGLPALMPPEESAAAGLSLGIGADLLEEAVFRFVALPLLYRWFQQRLRRDASALVAVRLNA